MASKSPTKPWWRRWFGSRSERAAARYLRGLGYRIVVRNWCEPLGELDLVALDGACLVFVEVRSTEHDETSRPIASVDFGKQRKLTNLALRFMQQRQLLGHSARFDVVAVSWPPDQRQPAVTHLRNAFEATGQFQMFS